MAQESLWGYDGATFWDSASWNLLIPPLWGAGESSLQGSVSLGALHLKLPEGGAGEAAGHQVLLIPVP